MSFVFMNFTSSYDVAEASCRLHLSEQKFYFADSIYGRNCRLLLFYFCRTDSWLKRQGNLLSLVTTHPPTKVCVVYKYISWVMGNDNRKRFIVIYVLDALFEYSIYLFYTLFVTAFGRLSKCVNFKFYFSSSLSANGLHIYACDE